MPSSDAPDAPDEVGVVDAVPWEVIVTVYIHCNRGAGRAFCP